MKRKRSPHIVFRVSQIASLIGKNPYQTSDQAIFHLYESLEKQQVQQRAKRLGYLAPSALIPHSFSDNMSQFYLQKQRDEKEYAQNAKKNLGELLSERAAERLSVQAISKGSLEIFPPSFSEMEQWSTEYSSSSSSSSSIYSSRSLLQSSSMIERKRKLASVLKSQQYCNSGKWHESKVLDWIERKRNIKIDDRDNGNPFCNLIRKSFPLFEIRGKIDGKDRKHHRLFEVKYRQNGLFTTVPEYEEIQVWMYLYLLDMKNGTIIQCFPGADPTWCDIEQNNQWVLNECIPRLESIAFQLKEIYDEASDDNTNENEYKHINQLDQWIEKYYCQMTWKEYFEYYIWEEGMKEDPVQVVQLIRLIQDYL